MALSAFSRVACAAKRTCGLRACTRSAAVSALRRPMSGVVWMIWRCRLLSDTSSSSTTPSSPTPAAARYINAGAPSPPAPITSTEASFSACWPGPPTCRSTIWRAYRSSSSPLSIFAQLPDLNPGSAVADQGDVLKFASNQSPPGFVMRLWLTATLMFVASATSVQAQKPKSVITVPIHPPALQTPADTANAMAQGERLALQSDLAWVGEYNGTITGDVSERMVTAIKDYQKNRGGKPTGVLNPQERAVLAETARRRQETVGWKIVSDTVTGARLGIP